VLDVEEWADLRRQHFVGGISIKELSRRRSAWLDLEDGIEPRMPDGAASSCPCARLVNCLGRRDPVWLTGGRYRFVTIRPWAHPLLAAAKRGASGQS